MADKTTTLKTKTNDNVYPNIIGDNRDNAISDSAHINHTLTADHKINFRLDTNVSGLIFNSLQKPKGLTKTKLVGVGANGQENIEIGDNLTLANGKLSATGGGSGGVQVCIVKVNLENSTYTSNIPLPTDGTTPVFVDIGIFYTGICPAGYAYIANDDGSHRFSLFSLEKGLLFYGDLKLDGTFELVDTIDTSPKYLHFITLTKGSNTIYLQYQNDNQNTLDMNDLKDELSGKKRICTGVFTDDAVGGVHNRLLYISGENGGIEVYYNKESETSNTISHITINGYAISDLVS